MVRGSGEPTSPVMESGLVDGRRAGRRAGSGLAATVAVALALIPGVLLGSIHRSTSDEDREASRRQPVYAFGGLHASGAAHPLQRAGAPRNPAELFQRQCVACHGKKGKGDGPAAPAMNPRPANLTDPERIGALSDEELIEVLTKGKGAMPSFGALLSPEEIDAMARYVRELSGAQGEK